MCDEHSARFRSGHAGHDADPLAQTDYGLVSGTWDGPVAVWRSIPYATAPAGPARFAVPEPPKPWDGVRECVVFGDIAPQAMGAMVPVDSDLQMGEDCLWVNVWSPRPEPSDEEPRPVLVWLHGGAYCLGTAAQTIYDGRKLAEAGDVVVVSVNYRHGVLGFLDLSSFGEQFTANLGLHDQLAALAWVRDNIAAFGGDPGNVTLFGESSGAGCVTALLTSPAAAGLFHKAIAQSPPATTVFGQERAAVVGQRYLELLELGPGETNRLLELPIERLVEVGAVLLDEVPIKEPGQARRGAGGRRKSVAGLPDRPIPAGTFAPRAVADRHQSR